MLSYVLRLLSTKIQIFSTGCLPVNVQKILLETLTGSTSGDINPVSTVEFGRRFPGK